MKYLFLVMCVLCAVGVSDACAATLYRSVGTTATNLNTSNRTVTISGTTATFNGAMPDNVGVGDALVYGSTYIAFISGRTSSTVFTVQSATGGTPTAASAGTTVGVYRSFNSLSNWEGNTTANGNINAAVRSSVLMPSLDLVTAGHILMVPCYKDGVDTASLSIDGWTTGASNYIRIYTPTDTSEVGTSQRHSGKAGTGFTLKPTQSSGGADIIFIYDEYVRIEGLDLDGSNITNGNRVNGIIVWQSGGFAGGSDIRISDNIIHDLTTSNAVSGDYDTYGVSLGNGVVTVNNNIIYNIQNVNTNAAAQAYGIYPWASSVTAYIYNNTIYNVKVTASTNYAGGILNWDAVMVARNNYVGNVVSTNGAEYCFVNWGGAGSYTSSYNISSDSTATGTGSQTGKSAYSLYFADIISGEEDLHLRSTNGPMRDSGTNLSSDPNYPFSTDVDGNSRPQGSAWDIGADETTTTLTAIPIYYSVGTNTAALYSGNASASNGTLTLASAASNNIGVGDEIRYGSNRYYITGRTSSTVFSIQNSSANGGNPGDTNITFSSTAITIYRAFNSLYTGRSGPTGSSYLNTTNLATNNYQLNLPCYKDGDDTDVAGTSNGFSFSTFTTSNTNYIRVYTPVAASEVGASQRHTGVAGTGYKFAPSIATMTQYGAMLNLTRHVRIEGLEISGENLGSTQYIRAILIDDGGLFFTATDKVYIEDNLIYGLNSTDASASAPVYGIYGQRTLQAYISNNIIYNLSTVTTGSGAAIGIYNAVGGFVAYIYNNTIYHFRVNNSASGAYGIYLSAGTFTAKNNYAGDMLSTNGSEYGFYGTFTSSTNNASFDGTASSATGMSNGITGLTNYVSYFSNITSGSEDFHLKATNAALRNSGADLSADANYPFSVDIDGEIRPQGSAWDIGADETTTTLTAIPIYYSVGTNTAALYSGNASASNGTLTLASSASNSIGVGDEVRVGSNRYYITARTSSTVFSIQNSSANGGMPGDTNIIFSSTAITIYRAYNSLFAAEAGSSDASHLNTANLVTGSYQLNWPCYADGVDSTAVTVDGWTTGTSNYIKIYTPVTSSEVGATQRHSGKWGDGYRRTAAVVISDEYVRLDGLSVSQSGVGNAYRVTGTTGTGEIQISNCFGTDASTSASDVFAFDTVAALTLKIWNCIGISKASGYDVFYVNDTDITAYIYNTTAVCQNQWCTALHRNAGAMTVKNSIGFAYTSNSYGFLGTMTSVTYSASNDTTADDWGGSGNRISQTFSFADTANDNYHLLPGDTGARDYGTSLSGDAVIPFSTDIDGTTRPIGASWDIGADEGNGLTTIYRSVGTTATNLNTGGNTVTITGTTATFSGWGVVSNIGVGDAIVYGSTNIAFISGRTNATTFTVQDAWGGIPTSTASTTANVYRAFVSLYNWEANTTANANIPAAVRSSVLMSSQNLVSMNYVLMVPCYADGADGTSVTIDGWTTGASNYIKIYTPTALSEVGVTQRHSGKWGNGYRLTGALVVSDEYVRLDGLAVYQAAAGRTYYIAGSTGTGEVQISNCLGWYTNNYDSSGFGYDVFDINNVGALTVKLWNCIGINDSTSTGSDAFYFNDVDATVFCYNCTGIANAGTAFRRNTTLTPTLKNCLGYSATGSSFVGGYTNGTYLASDDGTATGTGSRTNQTFLFMDAANHDYHLSPADAGARNYGTSLSADATIPFAVDIDGDARPIGSAWDIGADETYGVTARYRSVGTSTSNLNTSSRTVTISGTTATFNGAMPDNVGVGDALVYGSTYIAFISGRTSSTVFTVQDATGGTPAAASAGTSVGVYRSFNSLSNWEANTTANSSINAAVRSSVLMSSLDLVSNGYIMMVPCYGDGIDSTRVIISGWTTGPGNYIKIYTPVALSEVGTSQRHAGVWDDNKYNLRAGTGGVISVLVPYVWLDGLQVYHTADATGSTIEGYWQSTGKWGYLSNCILRGYGTYSAAGYGVGVDNWGTTGTFYYWNNIIYDFYKASTSDFDALGSYAGSVAVGYNNTIYNCGQGLVVDSSSTFLAKNNLVASTTNPYQGTFAAGTDYNATDIADNIGQGSNNRVSQTFSFVDAANRNLHLQSSDAGARDHGTSLSVDATLSFAVDIDGNARPTGAAWDIGADETLAGGSATASVIFTEY